MEIQGLQKLTLLDYPGKVACTVFLGGCNLRCPFCHNGDLVGDRLPALMDHSELLSFLNKRRSLLDGVCITGGEPLLRPDLPELLRSIKALGYPVKLDTNGFLPHVLRQLVEERLVDYVAMDVKNCPERYGETVGVPGVDLSPFQESLDYLLSDPVDYELRTTVVSQFHDEAAFRAIGPWIKGAKQYFLQSFVDRDTVLQPGLTPCPSEQLQVFAQLVRPFVPAVQLRGI